MGDLAQLLRAAGIMYRLEPVRPEDGIFGLTLGGKAAVPLWRKLRSMVDRTGHWPVVLGLRSDAVETLAEARERHPEPAAEILRRAAAIDIPTWIRDRRDVDEAFYADVEEGPWPAGPTPQADDFSLPFDAVNQRPHPEVLVALVPTGVSAEVPAYLHMGGWEDCPEPAVHVAFARRWHARYGAEIVGISRDTIEMAVARPPKTSRDALVLAREQYMYCSDIVEHGIGSVAKLAAARLGAPVWRFAWELGWDE